MNSPDEPVTEQFFIIYYQSGNRFAIRKGPPANGRNTSTVVGTVHCVFDVERSTVLVSINLDAINPDIRLGRTNATDAVKKEIRRRYPLFTPTFRD